MHGHQPCQNLFQIVDFGFQLRVKALQLFQEQVRCEARLELPKVYEEVLAKVAQVLFHDLHRF